jgi:hypothetical protein
MNLDENIFDAKSKIDEVIKNRAEHISDVFKKVNDENNLYMLDFLTTRTFAEAELVNSSVYFTINDTDYEDSDGPFEINDFPLNLFLNGSDQELTDYFISKFEDEVEENKRNEIWMQYGYLYNLDFDIVRKIIDQPKPEQSDFNTKRQIVLDAVGYTKSS